MQSRSQREDQIVASVRTIGRNSASTAMVLCLVVITGWISSIPILTTGLPNLIPSKFHAALGGLLLSIVIIQKYRNRESSLTKVLSVIVVVFAALTLCEYFFEVNLGIDGPIFSHDTISQINPIPGRMAPNSALTLLFVSVATTVLAFGGEPFIRISQILALGALLIALLALIGYAYSVEALYEVSDFTAMSLLGALVYFSLGFGLLLLHPDKGFMSIISSETAGGITARRLYPAILIIPPVLGSTALLGNRFGLYDTSFSISLVVVMCILTFALIVTTISLSLDKSDKLRKHAELALEHSRGSLRKLTTHVQTLQEDERRRIAREIHDELGQSLTALKMDVALLRNQHSESDPLYARTTSMMSLVDSTIRTVQRISSELRPGILDDLGLAAAIEWQASDFCNRVGIEYSIKTDTEDLQLDQARSTALFRIFQETLTNIARHAKASMVEIELRQKNGTIDLLVADNGIGIDPRSITDGKSLGIVGMRERALLLGGTVEFGTREQGGTQVFASFPLHSHDEMVESDTGNFEA